MTSSSTRLFIFMAMRAPGPAEVSLISSRIRSRSPIGATTSLR